MRSLHESNVTIVLPPDPAPSLATGAGGVWRIDGGVPLLVDRDGPATVLVPTESVLLLIADLPLPTRARRLEALPFAIEDRIAEPIDTVHVALGDPVAPRRYLAGVVREGKMAEWVAAADAAGLGHAAMVPDALALPAAPEGEWVVGIDGARALVRTGEGTGFAASPALLQSAWEAAGRPRVHALAGGLPEAMAADAVAVQPAPFAELLAAPPLDLRQGRFGRRARPIPAYGRRLAWIAAAAIAAHVAIAAADTLMLRVIADRRMADARTAFALAMPGVPLTGDLADTIAERLPVAAADAAPQGPPSAFLPLLSRISQALAPLSSGIVIRSLAFQGSTMTIDLDPTEPGLAQRVQAALRDAQVNGAVTQGADGAVRLIASVP